MKPKRKLFYTECHVAGRQYHEAGEVWDKLKIGTLLRLEQDKQNRYDANAIAIMYDDAETDEEYCLGYVPRTVNEDLAKFLEMGWGEMFDVRISKITPEAHYEQQLHIVIKIKNKEHCV